MRIFFLGFYLFLTSFVAAQSLPEQLFLLEKQVEDLDFQKQALLLKIEDTKLQLLHDQLIIQGLPRTSEQEEIIHHAALSLVYSEQHEQAKWVAHIISPDILNGTVSRSNDFRKDPLVKSGTAVEEDYFLRITNQKGEPDYDGFGWDRGHLAPSADFRWSKKGLSETYFYSNMSPQVPDFNRKSWAEVENLLRAYVYAEQVPLYVVTGGLLTDDLPVIERSINKISIPEYFWKVAVDLTNKRGIAFLMPNKLADYPTEHYAKSIDEIETLTNIDFFPALVDDLEQDLEKQRILKDWIIDVAKGDVEPLDFQSLPTDHFNTILGKRQVNNKKKVHICGTIVRGRTTRSGNVMFNLDKAYPNEIFNIFIKKENLIHFPNNPLVYYQNKAVCAYGEVGKIGKVPTVFVVDGKKIKDLD